MSRIKELRGMVSASQPIDATNGIVYGKKRTLPSLPTDFMERCKTPAQGFQLDHILPMLDVTYISIWLGRANAAASDLQWWWRQEDNAVLFYQFWLAEFDDEKRSQMILLEGSLLREEIAAAFLTGSQMGEDDLNKLLKAVFYEFPRAFEGDGTTCLDLVRVLANDRTSPEYRQLLSQLKCNTSNAQFLQWLLALRSFSLISFITSLVNFYRNLCEAQALAGEAREHSGVVVDRPLTAAALPRPGTAKADGRPSTASQYSSLSSSSSSSTSVPASFEKRPNTAVLSRVNDVHIQQAFRCAKLGFADSLFFIVSRGLITLDVVDGLGRSLLTVAVLHKRNSVIDFLLENGSLLDLDQEAHSGNTVLHVAVNQEDADLVRKLLVAGANPNVHNKQCNDATPLDFAIMHDNADIIALLQSPPTPSLSKNVSRPLPPIGTPDIMPISSSSVHDDSEEDEATDEI